MAVADWQRRSARAEELAGRYPEAAEILQFYAEVARHQTRLYSELRETVPEQAGSNLFGSALDVEVLGRFAGFLELVEKNAPPSLQNAARQLRTENGESRFWLLRSFWGGDGAGKPDGETNDFFARAFLQPYAVVVRERANMQWMGPTAYVCPFCKRKPGVGVLRPLGDGGQRALICSFCLGEWQFRRILCPGCGEGDPAKLPVYTAEELQHVRVEACDTCKSYLKTVDLTKSALGDPVVDEIASVPLDLWAQGQGYAKIQRNLMQL
jgi:FdhE protein